MDANDRDAPAPTRGDRVMAALPYVSLAGLVATAVMLLLSFEEPRPAALVLPALLLFTAPVGALVHLATTTELSVAEKRLWWRGVLDGRLWLFNAYFSGQERRATTLRLNETRQRSSGQRKNG